MKNLSKKIFIYILCAVLSVSTCSSCYFRSVYAFEYVGGALAFEEALKWLLGAIGIVSVGGMTADYWENHADDFEDYCAEQNITNATVAEWQLKLCEGILDKGSECWSAFKSWAGSLVSSGSNENLPVFGVPKPFTGTQILQATCNYIGMPIPSRTQGKSYNTALIAYTSDLSFVSIRMYTADGLSVSAGALGGYNFPGNCDYWEYQNGSWNLVTYWSYSGQYQSIHNYLFTENVTYSPISGVSVGTIAFGDVPEVSGGDMLGLDGVDTENLDIINSDIVDEEDTEVAIPMPGLGASDDTESADTYDDIVDAINQGLISLDDGISQIQDLLNLLVYDDTTDEVIPFQPDPDSGENKTKDEVIQENKDNMGFTLFGLEKVFPFCIPWDIVAFINVLKAPAVAPVFNLPFPNVNDLNHPLMIRVDLSDWDDAMEIFRLAEDFLFIIGLAFATRSLIGAGGAE